MINPNPSCFDYVKRLCCCPKKKKIRTYPDMFVHEIALPKFNMTKEPLNHNRFMSTEVISLHKILGERKE